MWPNLWLQDSPPCSHLIQHHGVNRNLQKKKMFHLLRNAPCCYMWALQWTKGQNNYLNDNWLCFTHIVSKLIVFFSLVWGWRVKNNLTLKHSNSKSFSKTWMQMGHTIINEIFMKAMTLKNMIKNSLVIFPPIVILIQIAKTNHLCLSIHHHKNIHLCIMIHQGFWVICIYPL